MTERPTVRKEERTRAEGLTLEELEAQVGGLLPNRIEMKRKRKRRHGSTSATFVSAPSSTTTNNACTQPLTCFLNDPNVVVDLL